MKLSDIGIGEAGGGENKKSISCIPIFPRFCFYAQKEVAVFILYNTVKALCDIFLVGYCSFATQTFIYTYLL